MNKPDLPNLFKFASLLHQLQAVERVAMTPPNKERWENDVEHSYQLAMLAWYLAQKHRLSLDLEKVLKYALVHDMAEAYAGDTYSLDEHERREKESKEQTARKTIKETFSDFPELSLLLEAYEKRDDPESRFVYALDKFIDPLNNTLNDWEPNQTKGITVEKMNDYKRPKVAEDALIAEYHEKLVAYIQEQDFDGA